MGVEVVVQLSVADEGAGERLLDQSLIRMQLQLSSRNSR